MEKIASFTVNHLNLLPGVYVSRKDNVGGNVITTFDLRMTRPNYEPVMNTEKIIYFGPMGCRTGFYLILAGEYESKDIVPLLKELYTFMSEFEGDVPGACARDCGNYLDMNLPMAKYLSKKYLTEVLENISEERLVYPE